MKDQLAPKAATDKKHPPAPTKSQKIQNQPKRSPVDVRIEQPIGSGNYIEDTVDLPVEHPDHPEDLTTFGTFILYQGLLKRRAKNFERVEFMNKPVTVKTQ